MEEEYEGKSNHVLWLVAPIVALFLYILSIGPVALISKKAGSNSATIRQVYAPVIWLHEHTLLKKPLELYVSFWGL